MDGKSVTPKTNRIAVIGGALQGVEVVYLANRAGFEVVLADRRPADGIPASGLCSCFRQLDATDKRALDRHLSDVDLIFPALESAAALSVLHSWATQKNIPMVHDPDAYAVSASKKKSHRFFTRHRYPVPASWPECRFPVIVKPDRGSGSDGIRVCRAKYDLEKIIGPLPGQTSGSTSKSTFGSASDSAFSPISNPNSGPSGRIIQEFLPGPTFSIEVIRYRRETFPLQITDLYMDNAYDCMRVTAPTVLSKDLKKTFKKLAVDLANRLDLNGIMDVEVVCYNDQLYVLEIDARFPSQTPMTVYHGCGINMVSALVNLFLGKDPSSICLTPEKPPQYALLEHIRVDSGKPTVCGEHIMTTGGPLSLVSDGFGADEALTNHVPGKNNWIATRIFTGFDKDAVWRKQHQAIAESTKPAWREQKDRHNEA